PQQSGEAWGPEVVANMAPDVIDLRAFVASLEKALVQRALKATNGGQAEAARRLGLTRSDIFYKLGKYKIQA
ncbi:MAG TPA: helix-turn-helix domain-containing protein, partial [Patescibacteria group bacterium]|nr:helix-turn-helix domain-containing protein [Patescibacteria group bacterium]